MVNHVTHLDVLNYVVGTKMIHCKTERSDIYDLATQDQLICNQVLAVVPELYVSLCQLVRVEFDIVPT